MVMDIGHNLLEFFPFRGPVSAYLNRVQVLLVPLYLMFKLFGISLFRLWSHL